MSSEHDDTPAPPPVPEPHSFCKCGRKAKCPDARLVDGGVVIGESVDDLLALEEPRLGVCFDREQAIELREWLQKNGF